MTTPRTVQGLIGDCRPAALLRGRNWEKAVAVDDVLDLVRELLQATGITAEMVCIDRLRVAMRRVDDGA